MTLDIVALGEPLIEFNQTAETGDGTVFRMGHGGDTSNTAIAAARSGARAGYVTALGADAFGDEFMRLWAAEGVDASGVTRDPDAQTGIYFVTHGPEGHLFSYRRAGSAASRMAPGRLPLDLIASARWLHVSGISQAISATACDAVFAAIAHARASGTKVSFDTNLRLKLWPLERARAIHHATVPLCDLVLPSVDDTETLTGLSDPDAIADFYLGLGAKAVALKLGPKGALVATGEERHRVTGRAMRAVDATGAGDTFAGALLACLARDLSLVEAARYANAAAALSTQGFGAVAPIPRRETVEAFMAEAFSA